MFYKETEFQDSSIGKIPKDWRAAKLTDAADYINGYAFSPEDWKTEGLPIIRIQNLNDLAAHFNYFDGKIDGKYLVRNGDLLFAWSASIGCYLWNRGDAWLNQHIFKVAPKQGIDRQYLYYTLFMAIEQLKKRVHGSTMKHFKRGELTRALIPLPLEKEEQRAIVGVLGVVDSAVELADTVIAKTERLKKGLMQQLLTRGIGHTEYKDTAIGKTPKTWQIARLEDVSEDFIGGGTPSTSNPEYWNGDIAWMTSAHINGRLITTGQKYITKKGVENSATHIVPKNNLLVATRVGIGKAAVNKIDIAISQDLTGVVINKEKALPEFLYWVLINGGNRLKSLAQGSTIKGILREELGKWHIPVPSVNEQKRIDEILSAADKKLELERNEKTRLERVKRGLMDLLLTGKVRVRMD